MTPVGESPALDDPHRRALLAAELGVYAAAEGPFDYVRALPAAARPMSPHAAVRAIARSQGDLRDRAFRVCGARLAVGTFVDRRADLRQCLIDLIGSDLVHQIEGRLAGENDVTRALVMSTTYEVLGTVVPIAAQAQPHFTVTRCGLDIRTMVSTVEVTTQGTGSFHSLAGWMDPRSWSSSPFWLASCKVIRMGNRFVPDPNQPPLGQSWKGYFYEYVQWAMNESVVSAFQCYLNVDYEVDVARQRIDLAFSLFSAAGSMLLERIAEGGVEVDSGRSTATPAGSPGAFSISSLKRIRYSDMVTRSTPNQGGDGAGQTLNYLAPAVVALWMDDLVYESTLAWSQGKSAPSHHEGGRK